MWETPARQGDGKYFFHGDLLITRDLVVAGADRATAAGGAHVHAFDRSTGRERWTRPAGRGVAAALVGLGQRAFAVALEGQLWSLDLASGERQWAAPLQTWAWEAPATAGDRVFAGAKEGTLYAFHADTGRVAWQTPMGAEISTSVARSDTHLYVGTMDGRLHRVDMRDGTIQASQRLDSGLRPRSLPLVTRDRILVLLADAGEDNRAVVALDPTLSRIAWRVPAQDKWSTTRVFVARQALLLGTGSGTVQAYCTADGAPAWSHSVKGTVRAIGGADDAAYVGTVEGRLYALALPDACDKP